VVPLFRPGRNGGSLASAVRLAGVLFRTEGAEEGKATEATECPNRYSVVSVALSFSVCSVRNNVAAIGTGFGVWRLGLLGFIVSNL
jgi:hypothetical protein